MKQILEEMAKDIQEKENICFLEADASHDENYRSFQRGRAVAYCELRKMIYHKITDLGGAS